MNLNKWIIPTVFLGFSLSGFSQASLDSLLNQVLRHNRTLAGASQYYENSRIASRTNLYPENPEIEYGHLWSSPSNVGSRTDFSVSQSFEFPSVYTSRSKMSKSNVKKNFQMLESLRQNTLLEAKQLWVEKVYTNRKMEALNIRMEQADKVSEYLNKQFENGEISQLRYNQTLLLQSSLRAELDLLQAESDALDLEIRRLSGGGELVIDDRHYFPSEHAILDTVLQSSLSDPMYLARKQEIEVLELQKKLAKASSMPRIKTGYYSESITGLKMQGLRLGISIPLWENANTIKAASGRILSAEMAAEKFRSDEESAIQQLHTRYRSYLKQAGDLSQALENSNDPYLLGLAVESGEISMVEYFYETDLYYRVLFEHLKAEKQLYLAEAELMKYEL